VSKQQLPLQTETVEHLAEFRRTNQRCWHYIRFSISSGRLILTFSISTRTKWCYFYKSRPFAVVLDGDPTALEVGRQIPVQLREAS
jgi:hypothetical protein